MKWLISSDDISYMNTINIRIWVYIEIWWGSGLEKVLKPLACRKSRLNRAIPRTRPCKPKFLIIAGMARYLFKFQSWNTGFYPFDKIDIFTGFFSNCENIKYKYNFHSVKIKSYCDLRHAFMECLRFEWIMFKNQRKCY